MFAFLFTMRPPLCSDCTHNSIAAKLHPTETTVDWHSITCMGSLDPAHSSLVGTENLAAPAEEYGVNRTSVQHGCETLICVPWRLKISHMQDGRLYVTR